MADEPIDETEANRLRRQLRSVLLAAADMEEAAAAARELMPRPLDDDPLSHVLETGMVVAYARPFKNSALRVPKGFILGESDGPDDDLHAELIELRDQAYAHTDEGSGRDIADYKITEIDGSDVGEITYWISRFPIERDSLPVVISLCERQADRFRRAAMRLHFMLNGEKPIEYW
jgi:hypothetical protein